MTTPITSLVVAAAASFLGLAGVASAAEWRPGTGYYVDDLSLEHLLERQVDFASCRGIRRFGHSGSFPDERFVVFECSVEVNGDSCYGHRVKTIKMKRRGYWTWKPISQGECY